MERALRDDPPLSSTVDPVKDRPLDRVRQAVRDAGLESQIRVGVPSPFHTPHRTPENPSPPAPPPTPGTEEAFPPDALLRPLGAPRESGGRTHASAFRAGRGELVELSGAPSSGRTSLAYRLAAWASTRGELVGWVDLPDALDPRYLRRTGLELATLLWVRPAEAREALRAAELLVKTGFGLVVIDLDGAPPRALERLGAGAWLRLGRALRATGTTGVVLGPTPVTGVTASARSHAAAGFPSAAGLHPAGVSRAFATLGLHSTRRRALFEHGLFEGIESRADVVRRRSGPTGGAFPFRVLQRS